MFLEYPAPAIIKSYDEEICKQDDIFSACAWLVVRNSFQSTLKPLFYRYNDLEHQLSGIYVKVQPVFWISKILLG